MTQTAEAQTQMLARELLNPMIPPLKSTDTVAKALGWMAEFHLRQLPVVENQEYRGLISEDILFEIETEDTLVASLPITHEDIFVNDQAHFYEVMQLAESHEMELMPVLDARDRFEGVISIKESVMTFARLLTMQNSGGIIVLLMDFRDYSLAEIGRLVEENGAKILSAYTEPDTANPQLMRVTLKINQDDVARIVATLERFEYTIIGRYEAENDETWARERIDSLFKFLEW